MSALFLSLRFHRAKRKKEKGMKLKKRVVVVGREKSVASLCFTRGQSRTRKKDDDGAKRRREKKAGWKRNLSTRQRV